MSPSAGVTPGAAPAAVTPLTEDGPEMTPVDKRLEELLQIDVSPQTLVHKLKGDADELRKKRCAVAKELKNAQKRTKRIRDRAKQLSDADLVAVLRMRTEYKLGGGVKSAADPLHTPETPLLAPEAAVARLPQPSEVESEEDLPPRAEPLTNPASDLIQT